MHSHVMRHIFVLASNTAQFVTCEVVSSQLSSHSRLHTIVVHVAVNKSLSQLLTQLVFSFGCTFSRKMRHHHCRCSCSVVGRADGGSNTIFVFGS